MTHKVGTKGQVVIPKAMREQTGLQPGVHVHFEVHGDSVVLHKRRANKSLKGSLKGGPSMTEELLKDRAREPR